MNKANEKTNRVLISQIRQVLDQQADSLDESILTRLQEARQAAVSHKKPLFSLPSLSFNWLTATTAGIALAAFLGFVIIPQLMLNKDPDNTIVLFDDFEVLSDESELDLYTQLDFYQWLDESLEETPGEASL